jgi:hypothetical protein
MATRVHLNKKNINLLKKKFIYFLKKKGSKGVTRPPLGHWEWLEGQGGARPPPVAGGGHQATLRRSRGGPAAPLPTFFFVLFLKF